jgi:hypothetical protein
MPGTISLQTFNDVVVKFLHLHGNLTQSQWNAVFLSTFNSLLLRGERFSTLW